MFTQDGASFRRMANINRRGRAFVVRWRSGWDGRPQTCILAGPSMELALAAKRLAEARHHKITDAEVYAAILGVQDEEEQDALLTPLLRDWVEEWLNLKVDVAASTHAEYTWLLRSRVVPALGELRVGDIDRETDIEPWRAELSQKLTPASQRRCWALLSVVMRDAVPRYRDDNPLDRQPGPGEDEARQTVRLTSAPREGFRPWRA